MSWAEISYEDGNTRLVEGQIDGGSITFEGIFEQGANTYWLRLLGDTPKDVTNIE